MAIVAVLAAVLAAPAAAADPSPGCVTWAGYGAAGITTDALFVDGPFATGETLHFSIDPTVSPQALVSLRYDGTPVDYGLDRGPQTFVVPAPVQQIIVSGAVGSPPDLIKLTDFDCTVAAAAASPSPEATDPIPAGPVTDVAVPSGDTRPESGSMPLLLGAITSGLVVAAAAIRRRSVNRG